MFKKFWNVSKSDMNYFNQKNGSCLGKKIYYLVVKGSFAFLKRNHKLDNHSEDSNSTNKLSFCFIKQKVKVEFKIKTYANCQLMTLLFFRRESKRGIGALLLINFFFWFISATENNSENSYIFFFRTSHIAARHSLGKEKKKKPQKSPFRFRSFHASCCRFYTYFEN